VGVIEWDLEIGDKVTAPANAMASAMAGAASKAQGLTGHVNGLRDSMGRFVSGSGGLRETKEHTTSLAGAWEMFEGSLAARVVERAFDAIVESGRELITTAIEASERVTHLTEVFGALSGGGAGGAVMGKAIFSMVRDLSKQLPQSEATIQGWTRSLMAAGVTDMSKLQASLRATAGAEALVEGGGEKVRGMLAKLNEASVKGTKIRFSMGQLEGTGLTEPELLKQLGMTPQLFELARKNGTITGTQIADAMTRALGEKAAGPLAGQMSEFSTIVAKGKDVFLHLFEGIDPKPLVEGMKDFFSIFDLANPSGAIIKDVIGGAFNDLFAIAGKVFTFLKSAFLQSIVWGLQFAIVIKQHKPIFEALAATIGGVMVGALAAMAVAAVPAIAAAWAVAAGIVAATWPFLAIGAAIGLVAFGVYELVKSWPVVQKFFVDLAEGAWNAAKGFVMGLVDGIANGVGLVVEAVENMGKSAWQAIVRTLKLGSPSRLMIDAGVNVSQGMAIGIQQGAGDVADASASMATAAVPRAGGASGGGGVSIQIGDVVVHVDGAHAKDAQDIGQAVAEVVEERLASLMNRLSNMSGAAPMPA
jgi:hypothetical protein